MLFTTKNSALVRLSDCVKLGIEHCLHTTYDLIDLYKTYKEPFDRLRATAKKILDDNISHEEGERKLAEINKNIPPEQARRGVYLQGRLHSECLSVLLNCCFVIESYANTLGYYLKHEKDSNDWLDIGCDTTVDASEEIIEKMNTLNKWEKLGKLNKGKGFDKSKRPYQDMKILFQFRNDIVHDKICDYSSNRDKKRYNSKLPDPVFGFLDLRHVIYAADTYSEMVLEIHKLIDVEMKQFHRHYNLKPWFSEDFEKEVRATSLLYIEVKQSSV